MCSVLPQPQPQAYPRYTVVAEKLEALTPLGMLNSRMKDFFDYWMLAKHSDFDGLLLTRSVAATFDRRRTAIPEGTPIGLSVEIIDDAQEEKTVASLSAQKCTRPDVKGNH